MREMSEQLPWERRTMVFPRRDCCRKGLQRQPTWPPLAGESLNQCLMEHMLHQTLLEALTAAENARGASEIPASIFRAVVALAH